MCDRVGSETDWINVSGGGAAAPQSFTCGIRGAGELWCWGANAEGQLGTGDHTNHTVPERVGTGTDWTKVTLGGFHGCGLRGAGQLRCWGSTATGSWATARPICGSCQCGLAQTPTEARRRRLLPHLRNKDRRAAVLLGLQLRRRARPSGRLCPGRRATPTQIGTATGWTDVGAGGHTSAILNGQLFCWGDNRVGEVGIGVFGRADDATRGVVPTVTRIGTASDWTDIAGGEGSSCGIRANNLLFCWGDNPPGDGAPGPHAVPVQAEFDKWTSISVGAGHKLGIRAV